MDGETFNALMQLASRRSVLRAGRGALAGVALGLVGLNAGEAVDARRRRRKPRVRRCGKGGTCRVFVSSTAYGGNLGGLTGADTLCQQLAESANLPGAYKAWLSDSADSPSTRFVQLTGPYVLVDGTKIAGNWTSLTDGSLRAAINLTETGNTVADTNFVWTHTQINGTASNSADHCGNWSSATGSAGRGTHTYADANWTQSGPAACNIGQHLYCFQQRGRS